MSILSWLRSVTHGGATTDQILGSRMQFAPGEEDFHGLDMRAALDAHIDWTRRLQAQIEGKSQEELEVGVVASDHDCTLGKWIRGEAQEQFGKLDEYQQLRRVHADFHLTAGAVLNEVQNGDLDTARERLKEIRRKSGEVQLALVSLYSAAHH